MSEGVDAGLIREHVVVHAISGEQDGDTMLLRRFLLLSVEEKK